jgi:hypothetical protein
LLHDSLPLASASSWRQRSGRNEFGGGIVAVISENVSAFATENYALDIGGEEQRAFEGNIGLTMKWCWQNVPMHGHSLPLAGSPV